MMEEGIVLNVESNVSSTSRNDPRSTSSMTGNNIENKDRILRRGDLARIIGLSGKLNDHHKGDLARIVRSNPINEGESVLMQNGHSFLYDIEFILGGKLNGISRSELQYTTAYEEGMTGDSRQRRKRKPTLLHHENDDNGIAETNSTAAKKKKKTPVSKKNSAKTSNSSKNANNKKRGSKTTGNTNAKKKSKSCQCAAATSSESANVTTITSNIGSNGIGMFERHRREFERCLVRLQKLDFYNFFSDADVPTEYDEFYTSDAAVTSDNSVAIPMGEKLLDTSVIMPTAENTSASLHAPMSSSRENVNGTMKEPSTITFPNHPPYNFIVLKKRLEQDRYIINRQRLLEEEESFGSDEENKKSNTGKRERSPSFSIQHPIGIHWKLFRDDVIGMCDSAVERNSGNFDDGSPGTLSFTAEKIKTTMEQIYEKTGRRQSNEMELSNNAHRFTKIIESVENKEAAMQGKSWRKKAFPERQYERLKTDAVCAGLSQLDERIASYELRTSLKDSFLGLSYTYNDTGQSEGWMKTMLSEGDDKSAQQKAAMALSSDDGVIKAQVAASMQSLLIAVQDRVMTETGVLEQKELRSANWECGIEKVGEQVVSTSHESKPEIVEQPVWGIDCYTRKNISICLETKFDRDTVLVFIEKWLLPAINACPVDLAYNLSNAARILEGLPFDVESSLNQRKGTTTEQWSTTLLGRALLNKIKETAPTWLHYAARILRKAIDAMGHDFFRVHPKGHGSIVLSPKIEPNRLVTFYRGEVYPSWRWGEKMDAISLIQKRNNLKPRLPDFYNMALERPQMDPRGYGLLFVDASRKSGYGSMLSHSCNPSCEVRVAAVNGKLTLAMTTLRELTIGDEVTFDYNAVTESLHEYQAAVCLCGQGHCRGSFLHFATADCYQQVLNRNSPVAVRLSQLIKGCAKKVMSDDDVAILKRHGFQTAAFGAVSVNRRKATNSEFADASLDSMDFVPIWLRTHVADILRYIEYERRALPIALISNQITRDQENGSGAKDKNERTTVSASKETTKVNATTKSIDDKPVKGSKPEPTFFFFLRRKRESFISLVVEKNKKGKMTGGEIESEIKKMASAEWKSFGDSMKQHWKEQAIAEWEKNGGKKKARLEQQRLKRISQLKNGKQPKNLSKAKKATSSKIVESSKDDKKSEMRKISFQAADAEGVTAMEQRIQQLTQALSRVGRVLDRHREELLRKQQEKSQSSQLKSPAELRELAHSPLTIMPDEHVVAWMWNHKNGIVRTLLKMTEKEICVSPNIRSSLKRTETKYSSLSGFGFPWMGCSNTELPMSPVKGRQLLDEALDEFRATLLDGIQDMAKDIKNCRASAREVAKRQKEKAEKRQDQAQQVCKVSTSSSSIEIRRAVKIILNDMIDVIEDGTSDGLHDTEISEPWLNNYNKRFKIEKAADLLLMYRRTSTFFRLMPYESLQSTPIEVYAREVGNSVPRSVIDKEEALPEDVNTSDESVDKVKSSNEPKKTGFCDPEDIISKVVVDYQGDYVLSQLLQWYNAGIDQKPGLPDILGCALLPSMEGCWTIDPTKGSNSATGVRTKYQSNIRPKLVEWFKDPFKRGNPWADELRRGFVDKDNKKIEDASELWLPIGSPVLDFLVTGDDHNLMDVLSHLGTETTSSDTNRSNDLLSSVDHGRPAQAVSNWVQCENPNCLKWRKIPWHVDIDMLSEKFVCSDHIWGLNPASCDTPEDDWDETTDACVEADGSVKPNNVEDNSSSIKNGKDNPIPSASCNSIEFKVGSRFDVLRPGKEKWSIAVVMEIVSKRIKLHFVKTQVKNDIWLDENSNRIAPLHTHTTRPKPKPQTKSLLPTAVDSSRLEGTCGKSSEVDSSKATKSKTIQVGDKIAGGISQASVSRTKLGTPGTTLNVTEKKKVQVKIEEEEESDGISFGDIDDDDDESDSDSDDQIVAQDSFEIKKDGDVGENFKEVEESPTVTDQSSLDGSLKRDLDHVRVEHSDVENECAKVTDKSNTRFTIPKKNNSSSTAIPKKVIPKKTISSGPRGPSLISSAARQAMLEKKKAKKDTSHSKRKVSLNHHPSKDIRQTGVSKTDHNSPNSKRKAFSDLRHLQSHHGRSPTSKESKRDESPVKNVENRRSALSRAIFSPKRSKDRYSIDQRREKELYRDSNEYTSQIESFTAEDSSHNRDYLVRNSNDNQDWQRSHPSGHRREFDISNERTYDSYSQQDDYDADGCRRRYYHSSHDQGHRARSRERSSDYYSRDHEDDNNRWSQRFDNRDTDRGSFNQQFDERLSPSRPNGREYHYDEDRYNARRSRTHEDNNNRYPRRVDNRDIEYDSYNHRYDERPSPSRLDGNDHHYDDDRYDDDRYNSRRGRDRRDSSGRREKRRKRKFDGSDEYSRRLGNYEHEQERNYFHDDIGRDRYNR